MAKTLGLGEEVVGRIDGTVRVAERGEILKQAQVVIMTPDVCQAWMMSSLALPVVKDFVGLLTIMVMDEAHTLESVFGSNFAFLIRRLESARNEIARGKGNGEPLQMIAATATIANPDEHLQRLTGSEFIVIDHDADGSRRYERLVAHVACPESEGLAVARHLQEQVLTQGQKGAFITFMDSRKGVEALAMATEEDIEDLYEHPAVNSYRAGFEASERREIELSLRSGKLRGVVSTSALELGIDFPSLTVGFNLGVPPTRKAYRQRLGRVGRSSAGAFVVIGTPGEFRQYGTSFKEYHDQSVEPSYLYLNNRFMQFAHGRCFSEERDALAAKASLPIDIEWPDGFEQAYWGARPGGNPPRKFDVIAQLGGDNPHRGYPLRNIGEQSFEIKQGDSADSKGDVTLSQALRECYPGATYYHNMQSYHVTGWRTGTSQQPYIWVKKFPFRRATRPRITTWLNSAITASDVLDGHLLKGEDGFLSECQMLITEQVQGFTDSSDKFYSYLELQQTDPNMKSKSRRFRTTGVILHIDHDWFGSNELRHHFSQLLRDVFAHRCSISPQDIGSISTNIAVHDGTGQTKTRRCVAVFDQTYGSLRFTEQLYAEFEAVLEQILKAISLENGSESEFVAAVKRIGEVVCNFKSTNPFDVISEDAPSGYIQVFAEGSRVLYREKGSQYGEVTIIEPVIIGDKMMYRVEGRSSQGLAMKVFVPSDLVEASADGDAWELKWWNRETQTYQDPPDEDESA